MKERSRTPQIKRPAFSGRGTGLTPGVAQRFTAGMSLRDCDLREDSAGTVVLVYFQCLYRTGTPNTRRTM